MPPRPQNATTETYPWGFGLMPRLTPGYRRQVPRKRIPIGRARITTSSPARDTSGQESESGLRPKGTSSRQSRCRRINGGEKQARGLQHPPQRRVVIRRAQGGRTEDMLKKRQAAALPSLRITSIPQLARGARPDNGTGHVHRRHQPKRDIVVPPAHSSMSRTVLKHYNLR